MFITTSDLSLIIFAFTSICIALSFLLSFSCCSLYIHHKQKNIYRYSFADEGKKRFSSADDLDLTVSKHFSED